MCKCALSLHVYQLHTLHTEVFILYICTVFFCQIIILAVNCLYTYYINRGSERKHLDMFTVIPGYCVHFLISVSSALGALINVNIV